jgi:integral membrane protein
MYVKLLGYAEGLSLLVLLFIAMPLKYVWGQPELTRPVGMVHGVLFVVYIATLLTADLGLTRRQLALSLVLSSVPFGPFVNVRRLSP